MKALIISIHLDRSIAKSDLILRHLLVDTIESRNLAEVVEETSSFETIEVVMEVKDDMIGIPPDTWHSGGSLTEIGIRLTLSTASARYDFPVTAEQKALILNEIRQISLHPPDYATFGERCTSVATRILRSGKVLPNSSKGFQESPFKFRKYLDRKFQANKKY